MIVNAFEKLQKLFVKALISNDLERLRGHIKQLHIAFIGSGNCDSRLDDFTKAILGLILVAHQQRAQFIEASHVLDFGSHLFAIIPHGNRGFVQTVRNEGKAHLTEKSASAPMHFPESPEPSQPRSELQLLDMLQKAQQEQ
jgi:hypothetical protein